MEKVLTRDTKLNAMLGQVDNVKINYEELKNFLNYEDIFFNTILKPMANQHNLDISFSGEFVIFKRRGGKE